MKMGFNYINSIVFVLVFAVNIPTYSGTLGQFNITSFEDITQVVNKNGEVVFMKESLLKKLEEEASTWHWTPWMPTRTTVLDNYVVEVECVAGTSVDSFPDGLFTEDQLRQGAVICYIMFGIYAFTLLAIICNDYFIPCVENICEDLNIPANVGAATFMSVATSCPEFFVNVISTFLTDSDMGIGTIVGSALFNALGVAAIGSFAAIAPIHIDRRPVTRDVLIYMVNVSVLVAIVWDGIVMWYEACVLGVLYVLYFIVMFNSPRLFSLFERCCFKNNYNTDSNTTVETGTYFTKEFYGHDNKGFEDSNQNDNDVSANVDRLKENHEKSDIVSIIGNEIDISDKETDISDDEISGIFSYPSKKSLLLKIWWWYTLPLRFILGITIPSPIKYRRIYPIAFIMCIVWIGVNSYVVSWSMTVIGHTLMIPDSVMGMTFLAFGGCLPEAFSIYIMSRRGEGAMGVSNALGANSLAILFALGVPWLIRTLAMLSRGEEARVVMNSDGIDFVVGSLLVAACSLWFTLYIGKFTMRRVIGIVLSSLYAIFITFAILVEMGIILHRPIPLCDFV